MTNRQDHFKNITDKLTYLQLLVVNNNSLNLTDVNIHAENFYRDLLNLIFGWKLENTNFAARNAANIDLISPENKIAIPVTSRNDNEKISSAIEGFFEKPANRAFNFKVLLISKNAKDYKTDFTHDGGFNFDKKKDVLDVKKILAFIENGSTEKITAISGFLDDEISTPHRAGAVTNELTFIQTVNPENIIGREKELKELNKLLSEKKQVVVVNGMGGIGKTTLAAAYIFKYYNQYRHIAWVTQSDEDIAVDFVQNGALLKSLNINTAGKAPADIFQEMLFALGKITEQPKLFVIDNATQSIERYLDRLPGQPDWDLLVTSREKIADLHLLSLDFLSEEEAVALFKKHCKKIKEDDLIKDLVKTVDYHTLTIEILAKTAEKQRTDFHLLKQALQDDLKANIKTQHSKDNIEKITSYLSTIFDFSQLANNENQLWLMKNMAALPPEFHTYKMLLELINPSTSGREEVFAETMDELAEKGWLIHDADTDSYKMHRVIQEMVVQKTNTSLEEVLPLVKQVRSKLRIDQTKDNPIDKFPWIPYGRLLLEKFDKKEHDNIALLQNDLGRVLDELGDYHGAKFYYEKALGYYEKELGENHENTAVLNSNLALVLQALGDYAGAKGLLEKAVVSDERNFGKEHPTTAVRYSNLATVLKDLGDYAGAKGLLEKAVISDERNFGKEHPNTAVRYSNLATVLQALGDYAGAKGLLEKAMISDERNFGKEHPTTAVSYSNLATVLQDLGDYAGAKGLLEKAVVSDERNFGEDHPNTAVSYSNLALVLKGLGDYAGAKGLLEKAVLSDERNFGEGHPNTAIRYSNLALVLQDLGELERALELVHKANAIFINALPEGHPNLKIMEGNIKSIEAAIKNKRG